MPHITQIICLANRLLDGLDPDGAARALASLTGATSLAEAAEQAGLFVSLSASAAAEARAALAALPPTVDAGIRAALTSALQRHLPAIIQWKAGPQTEFQTWESVEGGDGLVSVLLITPSGRDLGAATP